MVTLTLNRIDIQAAINDVVTPESGGIDIFLGTTRNHSEGKEVVLLEYESYEPMAVHLIEQIVERARNRWPIHRAVVMHRLGKVPVGEVSVLVAVSAAHRKEAFEACRFLIDTLKSEVPVWKLEYFADGTTEWSGTGQQRERQFT